MGDKGIYGHACAHVGLAEAMKKDERPVDVNFYWQ